MGDDQAHKWIINDRVRTRFFGIPSGTTPTIADAFTASTFPATVLFWDGTFCFGAVAAGKGSGE
jgi:hypothetical protein